MKTRLQDSRNGLRILRTSPAFAAIAVLTLALGIGANTAIFSFVDAWIIKPIPYPQADKLMVLLSHDKKKGSPCGHSGHRAFFRSEDSDDDPTHIG